MKSNSVLSLLIILIVYSATTQKTIPNNIVIPKSPNSKNIPTRIVPEEAKPILKVSPEIKLPSREFTLIELYKVIPTLYIDPKDSEYDGISLIAETLKSDLNRVIGEKVEDEEKAVESENGLKIITDKSEISGKVIIAGTYGENGNEVINELIENGKIDVTDLQDKWECYLMQVVRSPMSGVEEALIIVGTNKRGTIYGLLHISEIIGISPWVWWADVLPDVQEKVVLPGEQCNLISKEPSIKYRGIFLNDEAPSLTTWTKNRYGGRNEYFYRQVFVLLLRLKANYLWPSMWDDIFSEDGKDDKNANAKLADQYGIIMGTSHHEPCYRAGKEWSLYYKKNKNYDNICTVGMRGENDSTLPAADNPPKYAELLNYIINKQKELLLNQKDSNPTQLVIYKEVEDAWYAGELYNKDCMKNTYAMFCDDNWSYMRTLPTLEQQKTIAGLGMYYHFDYVGAPKSYTWVQNVQISRVWDQMSIAYDYGIDDVWIVNVGDLKPMELDISYFLDLAYDYETYGINGYEKLEEYKKNWALKQFYKSDETGLSKEDCETIASLISRYLDLQTKRKVEHVLYNKADSCSDMFSVDNYHEALDILEECEDIMKKAQEIYERVPDELKSSYYQLVYYPAMAVPNVLRIQIYAALNNKYANLGLLVANGYGQKCKDAISLDNELFDEYNNKMPGTIEHGTKWQGMISCGQKYHIGLQQWDRDSGVLPSLKNVQKGNDNNMQVLVESITDSFKKIISNGGEATLPTFHNIKGEIYEIQLCTKGGQYNYAVNTEQDWIYLAQNKYEDNKSSSLEGTVSEIQSVYVSINWDKLKQNSKGAITIKSGSNTIKVNVEANVVDLTGIESKTYVMTYGYATIDVAKYNNLVEGKGVNNEGKEVDNKFLVIPDNGKYRTALRTISSTITYENANDLKNAPYAEYKVYVPEDGTYTLQSQFNPTSNLVYGKVRLRYGLSIDGGNIEIIGTINNQYLAGTWKQGTWTVDIEYNSRKSEKNNLN